MAPSGKSNVNTALNLLAVVIGMVMLSYAAVPLYNMFCKVTGYGGTTQDVSAERPVPRQVSNREITVLFNADVMPDLPWEFTPAQRSLRVKIGEQKLAFFRVTNMSDTAFYGVSTFNVTPHQTGQYFVKTKCFCYESQQVKPGQTVEMPVSFFIDPALLEDEELKDLTTITLSYTFFKVKE